jgi:hypothetical protein
MHSLGNRDVDDTWLLSFRSSWSYRTSLSHGSWQALLITADGHLETADGHLECFCCLDAASCFSNVASKSSFGISSGVDP